MIKIKTLPCRLRHGNAFTSPLQGELPLLRLKGCAKGFAAAIRAARADRDLVCRAIGVTIVIIAVLYVALDPLDMLAAASVFTILLFFHVLLLVIIREKAPVVYLRKTMLSHALV